MQDYKMHQQEIIFRHCGTALAEFAQAKMFAFLSANQIITTTKGHTL